jgi:hypothetical protein
MSATLASLQARADGGQFTLTQTPNTPMTSGAQPIQKPNPFQLTTPHRSPNRTAIGWSAVYRMQRIPGDVLVVDTAIASQYLQLVLDHANGVLDAVDLRLNMVGFPPNSTLGQGIGNVNPVPGLPPGS